MAKVKDMRKVKGLSPMSVLTPYIMTNRIGSMNLMRDTISVAKIDKYVKEKQAEGMTNIPTNSVSGIPSGWTVKVKNVEQEQETLPGFNYVNGY